MSKSDLVLYLSALNIGYKSQVFIVNNYNSISEFKSDIKKGVLDKTFLLKTLNKIKDNIDTLNLDIYKEKLLNNKSKYLTIYDSEFPYNLKNIQNPPLIIYYKGNLNKKFEYGISVVGARKCTNYGAWACEYIASELSRLKIPTISGLALGIDSIVHKTCLRGDSLTMGVLGNGIDVVYPKSNYSLYEEMIISEKGCIITEYPLGTKPIGYNFPRRNRLISGFGLGTIVVEAKEKSGTLITANYAGEQGKEIFAIPGNINSLYSKGTNSLIKDGAKIVNSIYDILEELPQLKDLIDYKNDDEQKEILENLTEEEYRVYKLIHRTPLSLDEIYRKLDLNINEVSVIITTLELKGYISELQGGIYSVI